PATGPLGNRRRLILRAVVEDEYLDRRVVGREGRLDARVDYRLFVVSGNQERHAGPAALGRDDFEPLVGDPEDERPGDPKAGADDGVQADEGQEDRRGGAHAQARFSSRIRALRIRTDMARPTTKDAATTTSANSTASARSSTTAST